MRYLRRLRVALSYVTCLAHVDLEKSGETLEGLSKYLPLAGLFIGACLTVLELFLTTIPANNLFSAAIVTVAWLLLTNGLHFDGLMDTADGIFSHQPPQRMLEIMADSRVGNFGVLVGVSALVLKLTSLFSIPLPTLKFVLLLIPAWARWCETYAISRFPYLKAAGKGKVWHDSTEFPQDLIKAAIVPALLMVTIVAVGYWQVAVFSALTILCGVTAAHWLHAKLGGHTGDTYGSVVELAEVGGLVCIGLICPLPGFLHH